MATDGRPHGPGGHFRPDIEGLRAIAVVAVLLYHVGMPGIPGGFVGVDVFYVISGFLITGLLWRELGATGRVDLVGFYARRMRRLLPASLLVIVFTLVASALLLSRVRFPSVAGDAVAATLYVSNIRFALEATDYLGSTAAPSPLLHTWSLGVEEQFYLVWPVLLLLLSRMVSRTRVGWVLLGLAVASFALSLVWTDVAAPWAFFSLPTRMWELAGGAMLALGLVRLPRRTGVGTASLIAGVGLVLLGVALVTIDIETPFPGTAALLPVAGTMLLIVAGERSGAIHARMLALRVPRWLGRISYSLYLWHWPILVLVPIWIGRNDLPTRIILALVAVVIASASTDLIEVPIREQRRLRAPARRSLVAALVATGVVAALGVAMGMTGPLWRPSPPTVARASATASPTPVPTVAAVPTGAPTVRPTSGGTPWEGSTAAPTGPAPTPAPAEQTAEPTAEPTPVGSVPSSPAPTPAPAEQTAEPTVEPTPPPLEPTPPAPTMTVPPTPRTIATAAAPTPARSVAPTRGPALTPSVAPTATIAPSPAPSHTVTVAPTATDAPRPTPSARPSASPRPTVSPRPTPTVAPRPTATVAPLTPAPSPTALPTATPGPTPLLGSALLAGAPPDTLRPSLEEARDDLPHGYADGCHLDFASVTAPACSYGVTDPAQPLLMLVGDSHAAQWLPAAEQLAADRGWRLVAITKSGCPYVAVTVWNKPLKRAYRECDDWRAEVASRIATERPAVLLLAASREYQVVDDAGRHPFAESLRAWRAGLAWALTTGATGAERVALLADTPRLTEDPVECLAATGAIESCATPRETLVDDAYLVLEAAAAEEAGATLVRTVDWLCDETTCPLIMEDLLVYRDDQHLTATFAARLAGMLGGAIDRLIGEAHVPAPTGSGANGEPS